MHNQVRSYCLAHKIENNTVENTAVTMKRYSCKAKKQN